MVVVGQSRVGMYSALHIVDAVPDDVEVVLAGSPTEDSLRLAADLVEELGPHRVQLFSEPLTPGVENRLRGLIGARTVALVISASEDPAEQRVARELARRADAPLWGATCASGGWAGPDIPDFFGPARQRPALAMRLAHALAAVAVDAARDEPSR